MRPNTRRRFAIVSALCSLFAAAASAATITGTVTNGTTKTPAAGDTVTLIALIPVAYTVGTDFKPGKRAPLDSMVHWDTW